MLGAQGFGRESVLHVHHAVTWDQTLQTLQVRGGGAARMVSKGGVAVGDQVGWQQWRTVEVRRLSTLNGQR